MSDNNPPNPIWPQAPLECAWYSFVVLSVFWTPLLFIKEPMSVWNWPIGYVHCALLTFVWIGLTRNGLLIFGFTVLLGLIGILAEVWVSWIVFWHSESLLSPKELFRFARFLFNIVGELAIVFAIRGWILYFLNPEQKLELDRGTR